MIKYWTSRNEALSTVPEPYLSYGNGKGYHHENAKCKAVSNFQTMGMIHCAPDFSLSPSFIMQRVELSRGGNCWMVTAIQMRVDETTSDLKLLQQIRARASSPIMLPKDLVFDHSVMSHNDITKSVDLGTGLRRIVGTLRLLVAEFSSDGGSPLAYRLMQQALAAPCGI